MNIVSLPEWNAVIKTPLIVSTYWSNDLLTIGNGSAEKFALDRPKGIYYQKPYLKIATWGNLWTFREYTESHITRQVDPDCDAIFVPKKFEETGNIGSREIAGNFIAASKLSCVVQVDEVFTVSPVWKPDWIADVVPEDRCHVNGVALDENGNLKYVTALGTGNRKESWRTEPVKGCVIDVQSGRVIVDNLRMPHSPRTYQKQLWVCDSMRGELSIIDVKAKKRQPFVRFPDFVRGLAFWEDWAIVGLSKMRYAKGSWIKAGDRCGLAAVNLNTANIDAILVLNYDEIFDVQVLPFKNPKILDPRASVLDSLLILPAFN
jgi:uncharacterized protein (TIGR03032 family)